MISDLPPNQPASLDQTTEPAPSTPTPSAPLRGKWLSFVVVCLLVTAFDQGTKQWAHHSLQKKRGRQINVIKKYFSLTYVRNPGAAWGLLSNANPKFRKPFFISVSVIAMGFIAFMCRQLRAGQQLLLFALALVMGGALGNLIDRFHFGYVIDFLDFHIGRQYRWPTFNVADIAISVGVGLLLLEMLLTRRSHRTSAPSDPPTGPA